MATPGRNQRRLELHVVFLLLFLFANLSHAVLENSSMVWRYAGEEPSLVASVTSPQEYSSKDYISFLEWRAVVLIQTWRGYLTQKVTQESSADNAIDLVKGPCNSETKKLVSCPVQCFRVDPVCGTDNVTYWCGAADAKCAGVGVAHDGHCNLWELNANVGSTTAVRAAQSLQLVHILWLVVAGLLIVLGSV